jgi:hypothetical protein
MGHLFACYSNSIWQMIDEIEKELRFYILQMSCTHNLILFHFYYEKNY